MVDGWTATHSHSHTQLRLTFGLIASVQSITLYMFPTRRPAPAPAPTYAPVPSPVSSPFSLALLSVCVIHIAAIK